MFYDVDWPLNASRGLTAIAEFLVTCDVQRAKFCSYRGPLGSSWHSPATPHRLGLSSLKYQASCSSVSTDTVTTRDWHQTNTVRAPMGWWAFKPLSVCEGKKTLGLSIGCVNGMGRHFREKKMFVWGAVLLARVPICTDWIHLTTIVRMNFASGPRRLLSVTITWCRIIQFTWYTALHPSTPMML